MSLCEILSWSDKYPFNKIRPCLVKNGAVVGYLNPDNYAQFEDGTAADITSGAAGDVMVEIPIFYYKISHNDTHTFVQISSAPLDGFTPPAVTARGRQPRRAVRIFDRAFRIAV